MYIWHLPLLNAFQRNIGPSLSRLPPPLAYSLYWVWVAAIVIPFSFAVYQLVEKPGMRLRQRLRRKGAEQQPQPGQPGNVTLAATQASAP